MQTLNDKQVLIQNTKTGHQTIVARHFFNQSKQRPNSAFLDYEIVEPVASETTEKKPKKSKEVTE